MISSLKKFSDSLFKYPASQVFGANALMVNLQMKASQKKIIGLLDPLNHFLNASGICCGYFSGFPISGLWSGDNFSILIDTGAI